MSSLVEIAIVFPSDDLLDTISDRDRAPNEIGHDMPAHDPDNEIDLTIVTMQFDAADAGALLGVLSKYVVLARMQPGCRNIDLCSSITHPGRYLLIQKWDSPLAQQAHFDSALMVEMAQACGGILATAPNIDLWDGPSAHDLA